jgi:hypothetical protein
MTHNPIAHARDSLWTVTLILSSHNSPSRYTRCSSVSAHFSNVINVIICDNVLRGSSDKSYVGIILIIQLLDLAFEMLFQRGGITKTAHKNHPVNISVFIDGRADLLCNQRIYGAKGRLEDIEHIVADVISG